MSVIINEFEVVAEPESEPSAPAAPGGERPQAPAAPSAQALEAVARLLAERALRVRAD